jgi:hypothetical protein
MAALSNREVTLALIFEMLVTLLSLYRKGRKSQSYDLANGSHKIILYEGNVQIFCHSHQNFLAFGATAGTLVLGLRPISSKLKPSE